MPVKTDRFRLSSSSPTLSNGNHLPLLLALKHKDCDLIFIFVVADNFLLKLLLVDL